MSLRALSGRARNACVLCRERKRKCNGEKPCSTCERFQDECTYINSRHRRRGSRRVATKPLDTRDHSASRISDCSTGNMTERPGSHSEKIRNLEANTPVAFFKLLGSHRDVPTASLPQWQCHAWNLDLPVQVPQGSEPLAITDIISLEEMRERALIFFAEIHPVYNFLDQQDISSSITKRWLEHAESSRIEETNSTSSPTSNGAIDSVLCGIAALAGLFRGIRGPVEARLIQSARISLERTFNSDIPTVNDVTAWLLRVIYLRLAGSPHATWMACCTLMHMVETVGLHFDSTMDSMLVEPRGDFENDRCRRIYCISQLFNMWVSLDCGKTRINLRGASYSLPISVWTPDQLALWRASEFLNPDIPRDQCELEKELSDLQSVACSHSMLELMRCNIALCIFRRIRSLGCNASEASISHLLSLTDSGLQAATVLIDRQSPWWHIANIPFQVLCMCLVIDNRASLSRVQTALAILKRVYTNYNTRKTGASYELACRLANVKRRQRLEELTLLNNALSSYDQNNEDPVSESLGSRFEPSDFGEFQYFDMGFNNGVDGVYDLSNMFLRH